MKRAIARACPNFALVKYWGKADDGAMMPAVPSLSITLDGPVIEVDVGPATGGAGGDIVLLDGRPVADGWRARTSRFLDLVRGIAGVDVAMRVESRGGVLPASGLASSAAYFAALALAASEALELPADEASVSDLARRGSVSAARSVPGGFVVLDPARASAGRLSAERIFAPGHWDLAVAVAVVDPGQKKVGSSEGMKRTRETSPYYREWVERSRDDFDAARDAVGRRDLGSLGRIAERSCMRMHACAMAADPPIVYLAPATLTAVAMVEDLRGSGVECFYTIDAGPQVKVVCEGGNVARVASAMRAVPGVGDVLVHALGNGAGSKEQG